MATIKNGKQLETSGKADIVENDYDKEEILIIYDDDSRLDEDWILDTACTFHMYSNRDSFIIYEIISKAVMVMGTVHYVR